MRWEIISTQIQEHEGATNQHKRIQALVLRVYAYLLKLYPAAFRAAFADEMQDVFAMTVCEATGQIGLAMILWQEVCDLPINLFRARQQAHNQLPAAVSRVQQARWFVRIIAGLLGIFLLSTLQVLVSPNYHLYPQAIPFVLFLFMTSVSMLIAIRWERLGGLLTGSGGVSLGIFMGLYLSQIATSVEVSLIAIILIGLLWMLPFVIFGMLFYQLGGCNVRMMTS